MTCNHTSAEQHEALESVAHGLLDAYCPLCLATQRDEALARAKDAMTARAVYDSVVNENAALRAELARKTEALEHLKIIARAYAGDTGLSDQHSLWDALDQADTALAEPKAGGPSPIDLLDAHQDPIHKEIGATRPAISVRLPGTSPHEPDPFEDLLTWLDDMLWDNGVHKGACIEFGPELRRRLLALRSSR